VWRLTTAIPLGAPIRNAKGNLVYSTEDKATIADVEARCKAVMEKLGSAAGTQNIDRILRLPATINLPNKAKRDKGRVPCPAALLWFNGATCTLDDFPLPGKKKKKGDRKGGETKLPNELLAMLYLPDNGHGNPVKHWPTRSHLFIAFIGAALRKYGIDENRILEITLDPTYADGAIGAHVEEEGGEDYVRRAITDVINNMDVPEGDKRIIRLGDGNLTDVHWRAAQEALLAAQCPVYVRAGSLVQPLWDWERIGGGNKQEVLSAKLVKYNVPRLTDVLSHRAAIFQKFNEKKNRWVNVDPPKKVVETLIEAHYWRFPKISGIVTAPTMRPDGSLITELGYDEATQLWYMPAGDIQLPPIGRTKAEAQAALKLLQVLISECAFVEGVDRSVALAAIMTVVLRGAFEVAPLFFFHKPEAGTGASYLTKIIATVSLGREAVPLNASEDKKELPKELSAAAYEAKPILNLNNLTFDLESALLSQMITERFVDIRPFGKNTETVRCDCRGMTVLANGNNVRVVGELVRRAMTCRMDAKMERPETRQYKLDPIAMIQRERGKYLAAIFTMVRAYMNYDGKLQYEKINGLEGWSRFVQQPLIYLGEADPARSQEDARARDPERGALRARVNALVKCFGVGKNFSANDVYTKALEPDDTAMATGKQRLKYQDLFEAFIIPGSKDNVKTIGWILSKAEGRVIDGNSIQVVKDTHLKVNMYIVMNPQPPAAEK